MNVSSHLTQMCDMHEIGLDHARVVLRSSHRIGFLGCFITRQHQCDLAAPFIRSTKSYEGEDSRERFLGKS